MDIVRVLVVGLGGMGLAHARAYAAIDGFQPIGMVTKSGKAPPGIPDGLADLPLFDDYETALAETRPDAVSVNTWTDTHAAYAIRAMEAGAHVFVEKPLAATVADAQRVVDTAAATGRKLVVGYILRHHPSWLKLIELARGLGRPLVMRMNLNQQSAGAAWAHHKVLMESLSPIVDCGVHYIDVMCQITGARPVRVHGIGARLTDELAPDMYNYGQLQVVYDDGSIGWYEAGWGPMMSEVAFFVKDIIGPKGCVSIVMEDAGQSAETETHTRTGLILRHRSDTDATCDFAYADERLDMAGEPDHQELCEREQRFFLKAIREDLDLQEHMTAAVDSLRVVLAADMSIREGRAITL